MFNISHNREHDLLRRTGMLYNINLKKTREITDCFSCHCFNAKTKRCEGIDKVCFEYDEATKTIIDGVTKLPINPNNKGE